MKDFLRLLAVVSAFVVLFFTVWITRSYMEAQAFNRVTGKSVSTWDAMWIELRVQENSQ